jgi:O-succinylbenzoate synthase
MLIDRIDLYHVAMPLIYPWRTAYGEDSTVESILVRMTTDGLDGWGETTPLAAPCYSPEFAAGVFILLRDWLAPRIVGRNIGAAQELQARLSLFKENPFAKAGLESAWWALKSAEAKTPLHTLLGATRDVVEVGADFGVMNSLDELLTAVGQAVDAQYARIKLKFRPGWDVQMLDAVRRQHPKQTIHIDCNAAYTLNQLSLFRELDRFDLAMIEQPLGHDDLIDHAELQRAIATPVCLDESIHSLERARKAIQLRSCRYVNVKPGRVGGLSIARQIHDVFRDAGIPCWVGGMLESAVGAGQCVALAMLDNFKYPADIFPSSRFYDDDLADPPISLTLSSTNRPAVAAPNTPGSPSRPNLERLAKATIRHATVVSA